MGFRWMAGVCAATWSLAAAAEPGPVVRAKADGERSLKEATAAGIDTGRAAAVHRLGSDIRVLVDDRKGAAFLALELPGGEVVEFAPESVARGRDARTWIGRGAGDTTALVTVGDGGVFGTVVHDGREFRIAADRRGTPHLVDLEPTRFPDGDCAAGHADDNVASNPLALLHEAKDGGEDLCSANNPPPPQRVLDILVVHSPRVADPATQANHLINETNFVFANSGVTATAQLVGAVQLDPSELGRSHAEILTELRCAAGQTANECNGAGTQALDGVFALRDSLGADLVVMLVDQEATTQEVCGATFGPSATTRLEVPSGDYSGYAFAVVGDSCASGGSYTFVHELGHLMGGLHEWRQGEVGGGFYGYSRGYVSAGGYRDIMAVGGCSLASCPREPAFSDPNRSDPLGYPMGWHGVGLATRVAACSNTSDYSTCPADMQCAVQQWASIVEGYRGQPAGEPPGPVGGVSLSCAFGMPGYNQVNITPPSYGSFDHYVVELKSVKYYHFGWQQYYSGPSTNPLVRPQTQSYVRVAACNAYTCGPYTQAPTPTIQYCN